MHYYHGISYKKEDGLEEDGKDYIIAKNDGQEEGIYFLTKIL